MWLARLLGVYINKTFRQENPFHTLYMVAQECIECILRVMKLWLRNLTVPFGHRYAPRSIVMNRFKEIIFNLMTIKILVSNGQLIDQWPCNDIFQWLTNQLRWLTNQHLWLTNTLANR